MTRIAPYVIAVAALGLSACTNPYDPVQRGLGGGILGAASGAAIGAAAGGGPGAALGAAIGGATGIFGGVASTPPPPPGTYYGYPAYGYRLRISPTDIRATRSRAMGTQATRDTPPTPVLRAMDTQVIRVSPVTLLPGLWISRLLGIPRLLRSSRLWIPEPPALFSGSGSGSGYGYPVAGYPGDRPSEDWSPGAEYAIEPTS